MFLFVSSIIENLIGINIRSFAPLAMVDSVLRFLVETKISNNINKNDYKNEIIPSNQKMAKTCSHERIVPCLPIQRGIYAYPKPARVPCLPVCLRAY